MHCSLLRKRDEDWLRISSLPCGVSCRASRVALGKNPENLTEHQQSCLDEIKELYPKMFRGYQLKEGLRKVFQCRKDTIEKELKAWL
ncbi:MAG: transposase, partial [Erysipelotrichaceae bacterium]|nr:transposase [Erysipelotrichaceae bacterium]